MTDVNDADLTRPELRRAIGAGVAALAVAITVALIADAADLNRYVGTLLALLAAFIIVATYIWPQPARRLEILDKLSAPLSLLLLIIGAVTFFGLLDPPPRPAPPPFGCVPGEGPLQAQIASAGGRGAIVHTQATPASTAVRSLPPNCPVRFSGYCLGATVRDASQPRVPDSRWLILPGEGLVANGDTIGKPPPGTPVRCPGSVPAPSQMYFSGAVIDRRSGRDVRLTARSERAAYIGFAVRLPSEGWRRVGWDYTPGDAHGEVFDLQERVIKLRSIVASACLGYRTPAGPLRSLDLRRGNVRPDEQRRVVEQPTGNQAAVVACDAGAEQAEEG